jgi:hypothetical protein
VYFIAARYGTASTPLAGCSGPAVYEVNRFDAYSTEADLADLFEKTAAVRPGPVSTKPFHCQSPTGQVRSRDSTSGPIVSDDAGVLDRRGQT